jgi:hypothetical protein
MTKQKSELVQAISADEALTSIRNTHFSCKVTFLMPQQTKLDRSAQAEVENSKNAHDGYKVRRRLYAKETLDPFTSLAAQARSYLRARTTQMGDIRLLAKDQLFDVTERLEQHYFVHWNQLKTIFAQDYAKVLREAELAQGDGFDPSVYPDVSAVVSQFQCSFDLYPVGDIGGGIFDDLEADLAEDVAQRVKETTLRGIKQALTEPLSDLVYAIMNIHDKTNREGTRISPSLMGNLEEITALIPSLNVINLPMLNELAAECRNNLLFPTEAIGADTLAREQVAHRSTDMLKNMGVDVVSNTQKTPTERKQASRDAAEDIINQMKGLW